MRPQPKPTTARDEQYLEFIRRLPCAVCGNPETEPDHVGVGGMGIKCSDYETIPVCRRCHTLRHDGHNVYSGIDIPALTVRLNRVYENVKDKMFNKEG